MLMAKNVHDEAQPYLPTRRWVDGSIADDLPAKRLSRLYSTNHFIVSMVNPIAAPFLNNEGKRNKLGAALGSLGVGVGRELLNFYRGIAQKQGDNWPKFNLLLNSIHSLMDQEYSGDINIVPTFGWYSPAKILSHLSEKELLALTDGGQHSTFPHIESIRVCTKISRTMEEILQRFEYGDLRPTEAEYRRPRSSRRRPQPTRSDREALRERSAEVPQRKSTPRKSPAKKKPAASSKAGTEKGAGAKSASREKSRGRKAA